MNFNADFQHDFEWLGKRLRVGMIGPHARAKISEGIKWMSKETIRHRFFGIKNGFTDRELKHLTEIDGVNHFAIGIVEAWENERGIAILRMVRDDQQKDEAEVALLIIDAYQRKGLGTLLMNLCVVAAAERGIQVLRFTYLPDNHAIAGLIRRFGGSMPEVLASDYVQMRMQLTDEGLARARSALQRDVGLATSAHRGP